MKGAICGLFASTLLLTIAPTSEAWAQKNQRVVVEKFSGPGTVRLRSMVLAVLSQRGADVIPIEKVTSTEADLGLLQVSDNYAAVAKELKVNAFFGGTISGKGRKVTARLRGTGADGKPLGQAVWNAKSLAKLFAAVGANLSKKMGAMLSGAGAPAGKAEEVAEAPEAPSASKGAVAAADADEAPASKRKVTSDDDPPPRKRASKDDDETVSARADADESTPGAHPKLEVDFAIHAYRRDFTYNAVLQGDQQAYKLPGVPAPSISVDYFFVPNFGVTAGGEYSLALTSQDGAGNKYKTSSWGGFFGGKGRYFLSGGSELQGTIGYARNAFKIVPAADDPTPPHVAGVDYEQVRVGASARIPLNDKMALIGGGDYLHVLTIGQLKKEYFPNTKGRGGEGFAGVAFALSWMKGLEGRATLDVRRYVFSMNPVVGDARVVGGATDQYLGLNVGVGYRN
jgi:hypothetical protein